MANEYLYGAYGHIGETVAQSAVQAGTTPVYIGTAPVNLVRGFGEAGIINAPIKITSLVDAQKKIGYSSDWGTFTLCEAVYAHFNNTLGNIGPIYVINVLDPSAGKHRKEAATTKALTFTGGRAAEELIVHSITTGASNEIEQATKMARALITRYGMTEDFDMVALETVNNSYLGGDASLACSEQTASRVDAKVVEIVQEQHKKAYKLLADNRRKLDEIAQYLYEKETISGEEFMRILNAQPQLPAATPADSTNNSL